MEPQGLETAGTETAAAQGLVIENPKLCFDDSAVAEMLLAVIDWNKAETREGSKGPFKTTTQHSFQVNHGGYRYQFGISVNRFEQTKNAESLTPAEKRAMKTLDLTEAQILSLRKEKASTSERAAEHIGSLRG